MSDFKMVGSILSTINIYTPNTFMYLLGWLAYCFWASSSLDVDPLNFICFPNNPLALQSTPPTYYQKAVRGPARMQVSVLCFGASITAGWSALGRHYYPYATRLLARLADELPTSHFTIDVDGSPGDTLIRGRYFERMNRKLESVKTPYDWVIIQAGGNDLAWNSTPEAIFERMNAVWNIALDSGAKVLALTITEHAHAGPRAKAKMNQLNSLIMNQEQDNVYVADVAKAIPWTGLNEVERNIIWDDGVHLKQKGYELMGDTIADRLVEIIKVDKSPDRVSKM